MTEREIFLALLDLPDPAARVQYLDEACGGDPARRARIESLLLSHDAADSFLDNPAVNPPAPDPLATQELGGAATPDGDANEADADLMFLAPPRRADSLGRLGHYEMLQVLGRGGFGIVFRAFDETLQRVVAVKVMAPQIATLSPARKRFLREAQSSAQIRHENVVQVYEVGEQPLPYLAMEFIPGETLQQKLDRTGPLEVSEVLRVGRQIAEGLSAAHACDLIHRDIKPANVLIEGGPQQRVKITDFGLARAADDASISQSGIIAGTPMFMAPEQALGHKIDQRADLFSLGSVLYQMVSGRPPFRAPSALAVLKRVAEESPRPIPEIIPETPAWLCEIIAKLHAKNPDDRFQSAREIAEVLADCEAQLKAHGKVKDFSRIPRGKPRRSGRWKWVAAAAVLLLAVIALLPVIAVFYTRVVTDFGGLPHLFRGRPATSDANKSGGDPLAKAGAGWNGWPADAPPPAVAPFDAAQARANQEAWSKYLGAPVELTNSIGLKLRFIPPGKFTMGSSQEEIDSISQNTPTWYKDYLAGEGPQHELEITQPFYMGQTEVTVGQFRQFVKTTGYKTRAELEGGAQRLFPNWEWKMDADTNWLNPSFAQTDDHPVVCVSWNDAVEFCNWMSKREGKTYRLPTEAEWEYSCRAGSKDRWFFGDNEGEIPNYARTNSNSQGHTWPVAGLKGNPWGLHDMQGNAWEWCQDLYDANYYKSSPPKDPPGPNASGSRVQRGGSWSDIPVVCRSAFRLHNDPSFCQCNNSFRVVLVDSPPASVGTESGARDKPSSTVIAPFTDADVQRIAALPAEEQVEKVRKELMRRNPGFDGKLEHKIEDGVVTEFRIVTDQITDIAPIRVWGALRVLECGGTWVNGPNGLLADLTPLQGMAALTHLNLIQTKVTDAGIAYFKSCKDLKYLNLNNTRVTDKGLAHLKDCQALAILDLSATKVTDQGLANLKDCRALTHLLLGGTKVTDAGLANFKGMPLILLWIDSTGVTDLNPLRGMPLEEIYLTPKNITRGVDILRDMKSLKTIGIDFNHAWPAAEFWERYDKGEFKE